jgi:hypothetical protein
VTNFKRSTNAEAGEPCPRIWMTLTSGDLVTGVPRSSRDFVDGSFQSLTRRYIWGEGLHDPASIPPRRRSPKRNVTRCCCSLTLLCECPQFVDQTDAWGAKTKGARVDPLALTVYAFS